MIELLTPVSAVSNDFRNPRRVEHELFIALLFPTSALVTKYQNGRNLNKEIKIDLLEKISYTAYNVNTESNVILVVDKVYMAY